MKFRFKDDRAEKRIPIVLDEMATDRVNAIERCYSLGKQFIAHFHKVYAEGVDSPDFPHHCIEMNGWLKQVRDIKLKATKKPLTDENIIDWFFTATGLVDEDNGFHTDDEIAKYERLIELLCSRHEMIIEEAVKDVL